MAAEAWLREAPVIELDLAMEMGIDEAAEKYIQSDHGQAATRRLRLSKIVVLGAGSVGKTSLLRRLRGERQGQRRSGAGRGDATHAAEHVGLQVLPQLPQRRAAAHHAAAEAHALGSGSGQRPARAEAGQGPEAGRDLRGAGGWSRGSALERPSRSAARAQY